MDIRNKLFLALVMLALGSGGTHAQKPVGNKDDQVVVSGCVQRAADVRTTSPHGPFVWSKGDFYLSSPVVTLKPAETRQPVGTTGRDRLTFYWIDDEDDFARYDRHQVEIIGELSDELRRGEVTVTHGDNAINIEFNVRGHQAVAKIPVAWLGQKPQDHKFDVAVRTVDVEKVTVLGACASQ